MAVDLTTNYGGLQLVSPIVAGACPLMADETTRAELAEAGVGAIVLPSIFEEQIIHWSNRRGRSLTDAEQRALSHATGNGGGEHPTNAETYLALVNRSTSHASVPVIASMNGTLLGGWVDFAGELQAAGASGIELNVHHPPGAVYHDLTEIEDRVVDLAEAMRRSVTVPVFLKLGREYTSLAHLARRLLSGIQGLVMHGRSPEIDICLETRKLNTRWGLTTAGTITQSIGRIMAVHADCPAMPIAASGGISSADDVVKSLLAGADVAMVTSAIYRDGPAVVTDLVIGLRQWMEQHQLLSVKSIHQIRPLKFATQEDRAAYIAALAARL